MDILKVEFQINYNGVSVDHPDVRPSHHIESDIIFATAEMYDEGGNFIGDEDDIFPIVERIITNHLGYKYKSEFKIDHVST